MCENAFGSKISHSIHSKPIKLIQNSLFLRNVYNENEKRKFLNVCRKKNLVFQMNAKKIKIIYKIVAWLKKSYMKTRKCFF